MHLLLFVSDISGGVGVSILLLKGLRFSKIVFLALDNSAEDAWGLISCFFIFPARSRNSFAI